MNYKLSIITVCYNAENEIARTIESVLKQTFNDFEYIIVDGSSTDSTLNIVNNYKSSIQQIISEPDKSLNLKSGFGFLETRKLPSR